MLTAGIFWFTFQPVTYLMSIPTRLLNVVTRSGWAGNAGRGFARAEHCGHACILANSCAAGLAQPCFNNRTRCWFPGCPRFSCNFWRLLLRTDSGSYQAFGWLVRSHCKHGVNSQIRAAVHHCSDKGRVLSGTSTHTADSDLWMGTSYNMVTAVVRVMLARAFTA